jgi:hypothetical protein
VSSLKAKDERERTLFKLTLCVHTPLFTPRVPRAPHAAVCAGCGYTVP